MAFSFYGYANVQDEPQLSIGIKKKTPRYHRVITLNGAFDLIKKEWENSWLADKFAHSNAYLTSRRRL